MNIARPHMVDRLVKKTSKNVGISIRQHPYTVCYYRKDILIVSHTNDSVFFPPHFDNGHVSNTIPFSNPFIQP
jgi:hypothetical protein